MMKNKKSSESSDSSDSSESLQRNLRDLDHRVILSVTLRAHVALAAAELENADLCIATVLQYFRFNGCAFHERRTDHDLTSFLGNEQYIVKRELLGRLRVLQRNLEVFTLFDHLLEAGDRDDCEHRKDAENADGV